MRTFDIKTSKHHIYPGSTLPVYAPKIPSRSITVGFGKAPKESTWQDAYATVMKYAKGQAPRYVSEQHDPFELAKMRDEKPLSPEQFSIERQRYILQQVLKSKEGKELPEKERQILKDRLAQLKKQFPKQEPLTFYTRQHKTDIDPYQRLLSQITRNPKMLESRANINKFITEERFRTDILKIFGKDERVLRKLSTVAPQFVHIAPTARVILGQVDQNRISLQTSQIEQMSRMRKQLEETKRKQLGIQRAAIEARGVNTMRQIPILKTIGILKLK